LPAFSHIYIDDLIVIPRDGSHLSLFGDDIKWNAEGTMHLLKQICIVAEVGTLKKVLNLDGEVGTYVSSW
jgi:hypothetical protein